MIFELFCSNGTTHLTRRACVSGSPEIKKIGGKYKARTEILVSRRGYFQGFTMKFPNGMEISGSRDWTAENDANLVGINKYKISHLLSELIHEDETTKDSDTD